jgi:hypothetical protein
MAVFPGLKAPTRDDHWLLRLRLFQDALVRKYLAYGVSASFSPTKRDKSSNELRGR